MEKIRKQLVDVLVRLNRQAVAQESSQLEQVLQLEKLLNKELTTKKAVIRQQSEKKQSKLEEQLAKKEIALAKEVQNVIIESQSKLKQLSDAVAVSEQPKPKNYHYQPSNPPPPRPPTKKEPMPAQPVQPQKRMSIAEQNRQRREQKSRQLLLEKEEARTKKESVTGKVTELPPPNPRLNKSVEKPKSSQLPPSTTDLRKGQFPPIEQKGHSAKQPEKTEALSVPKQESSKSLPTNLESFTCAKSELAFLRQQPNGNRPKLKSYLDNYRKEELGYRQEQNKARQSFLKRLGYFVPFKQNSDRHYTESIDKRGWKGCDYVEVMQVALSNVNGQEIDGMIANRKTKAIALYEARLKMLRIQEGMQCLRKTKAEIRAPKILDLQLQIVPQRQKAKTIQSVAPLSVDSYLLPVYNLILPVLRQMLQMRQLSKNDVKLLAELLSFVQYNSRKFITVVEKVQLQQFLQSISAQY